MRIHIVPFSKEIGLKEIDNYLKPLEILQPDLIVLLINESDFDDLEISKIQEKVLYVLKNNKEHLRIKIIPFRDIEIYYSCIISIINSFGKKIPKEKYFLWFYISNDIYSSIVATLIKQFHDIKIYRSNSNYEPIEIKIPAFKMDEPNERLLEFLSMIDQIIDKKKEKFLFKKECLMLIDNGLPRNNECYNVKLYSQLKSKYINPLLDWGFIELKGQMRNSKITITGKGKSALKIYNSLKNEKNIDF